LIAALRAICEAETAAPHASRLIVGIGDDAAVWQSSRSHRSVATTDMLVDGVHFLSASMSAREIGHRAMAANLSDLAAMGARPRLVLVALGITTETDEAWVLDCYRAMAALCAEFGARIGGGDLSRAPALTLAITALGEVSGARLKRRDGGRPRDVLAVTGPLGASRAGLELLRRPVAVSDAAREVVRGAFATPRPRVREGRWFAVSSAVHALMDCSDGLAKDVGRIARASGCGAVLDRVPVSPAAVEVAQAAGADPVDWALGGGEDFELIVAVAPRAFGHLGAAFARRFGRPLERVGALTVEAGLWAQMNGQPRRTLPEEGWDHLAGLRPASEPLG
jgi:thiamine-monophosphate kinase